MNRVSQKSNTSKSVKKLLSLLPFAVNKDEYNILACTKTF